ncbi:major facilitator superfamily protein [Alcanivorax sp. 521-1]|uniref:Major facilitator superfamily protein n=1 Tax=Alloalcanivorax profundimaris TaxID=2735259 RepID=A0ABS0ASF8_9GAMM|nr:MFS transporter [Alloalcanivorax profundimaris]MBF5056200.1 major facilitator superfamily protein [Alloalcanivorax profundimaris]|tara:strand:- start:2282 stop:3619 length:1338 start_codon:yes stop_codon:yes gene_type:complete
MPDLRDSLWTAWRLYSHPRVVVMLFLGFSAGLPYLLVFSTLSAWLADADVDRAAIGYFSWVGIMFSIKVFWAPVVDRLKLPLLGRALGQRRSWLLLAQIGIGLSLAAMALVEPVGHLERFAQLALLVAFCSATQDICIDAYRIDSADDSFQGAMAATYILGYRVAMLVAGAGAFYIASYDSWNGAYHVMAWLMAVGVVTTLIIREPDTPPRQSFGRHPAQWLETALIAPFRDFLKRYGTLALGLLALVAIYRISDITMGVMANPFYLDIGYTKNEIATVAKFFGFFMTILGSAVGGLAVLRWGLGRSMLVGAVGVALTNLLFAVMATYSPVTQVVVEPEQVRWAALAWLAAVISADNLFGGFANVALIAFMSSLTNRNFSATQFALFSSLMTLPGKFIGGFSGEVVKAAGYPLFFNYAALLGVPGILLVLWWLRYGRAAPDQGRG